jgi:hypothetical protein
MGVKRNVYRFSVGTPEGKRPVRRPRHRWVANIKMDLGEIGWGGMDGIDLSQDRDQEGSCKHGKEPSSSITFWEILEQLHNWGLLKKGSVPRS